MPWPDFSELTFGFGFLREFERDYTPSGQFPKAPDFISQADEANKGFDVEVEYAAGTPVFFQFKRSFVVRSYRATEYNSTASSALKPIPIFRMELRKKNSYSQHKLLRELETDGNHVFYVTSQVADPLGLSKAYRDKCIVERASALFSPCDIPLPTDSKQHFVSFKADASFGLLFSDEPEKFERRLPSPRTLFSERVRASQSDFAGRRDRLERFNARLMKENLLARRIAERVEGPLARASILAALVLDAQMTIVGDDPSPTGADGKSAAG